MQALVMKSFYAPTGQLAPHRTSVPFVWQHRRMYRNLIGFYAFNVVVHTAELIVIGPTGYDVAAVSRMPPSY